MCHSVVASTTRVVLPACCTSHCRAEIGAIIDDFISGVRRALEGIENGNGKRRR